jgi:hypothetical protein
VKLWPRRKRTGKLSRQLALGMLQDGMGRTEEAAAQQAAAPPAAAPAPPAAPAESGPRRMLYAPNGSADHFARPGAWLPLCPAGDRRKGPWFDARDRPGAPRPVCGHCTRIDAASAAQTTGGTT